MVLVIIVNDIVLPWDLRFPYLTSIALPIYSVCSYSISTPIIYRCKQFEENDSRISFCIYIWYARYLPLLKSSSKRSYLIVECPLGPYFLNDTRSIIVSLNLVQKQSIKEKQLDMNFNIFSWYDILKTLRYIKSISLHVFPVINFY